MHAGGAGHFATEANPGLVLLSLTGNVLIWEGGSCCRLLEHLKSVERLQWLDSRLLEAAVYIFAQRIAWFYLVASLKSSIFRLLVS